MSVVLVVSTLSAVAQQVEQNTIADIEVRSVGDTEISRELVLSNMRSAPDKTFDPEVLSADIKRLYKTGQFQDVAAQVERVDDNRLKIIVTVLGKPMVGEVVFKGNRQIDDDELRGKITQEAGQLLRERVVSDDANKLREYYSGKGYKDVEVSTDLRQIPDSDKIAVTFNISEGDRAKVRRVDFSGNTVFKDRQLRKSIRTRHSWWAHILGTGYLDKEVLQIDRATLQDLYQSKGYMDFRIRDVEIEYTKNRKWAYITFVVDEGVPYTVENIAIEGNSHFSDEQLQMGLQLTEGERFSTTDEQADVRTIRNRYQSAGYLDARIFSRRSSDPETHTVDVTYQIDEGRVSEIRDIHIVGNTVTQDHVLRRELLIHPGDLGNMNRIRASQKRLQNLNYFDQVDITPVGTEQEGKKDLRVSVSEKRTGQLMLGAGFSSEEDFVGMFEIAQTNFDWKNWPRFTGGGQRLRLRINLGTETDEFSVSFREPWLFGRRLQMDLEAYSNSRENDEYTEERLGASMMFTRGWRQFWRQSYGLRVEEIDLTDFDADVSPELLREEGSYTNNMLTYRLTRDTRNRFINPSSGSKLTLETNLMAEAWGSYSNIYRASLGGAKYFPFLDSCVLKLGGEIGLVDEFSGDAPAIFNRYFAGGAYSIRGFERREVGPVDSNEDPIGGQSILLGTAEFIFPIYAKISGSVFCDVGNVWADAAEWTPGELNVSLGIGLQFDLPIGPVRFDYGFPVRTEQEHLDSSGRLHFNLGYFF